MIKVGITGGMGSGKTTVCRIFETLQIPIYYADERARHLMEENMELREKIKSEFGAEVYKGKKLQRKVLAAKVFHAPEELEKLNALVHPAVRADAESWVRKHSDYPYIIKEAALLFESGSYRDLDLIITVTAPYELRIQRILSRDGITRIEAEARISRQWPEKEKVKRSRFVIVNDEKRLLIPQVAEIHRLILDIDKKKKL